jgi:hypothetical protein
MKLLTFRSERYRAWLRRQPCVICSRPPPNEAHHEPLGENFVGGKPPDTHGLPTCAVCHYQRHSSGPSYFEGIDVKMTIIKHITRFLAEGGKF